MNTMKNDKMKKTFLATIILFISVFLFAQPGSKYDISGNWYAYDAEGNRIERMDIMIVYNDDLEDYYAHFSEWVTSFQGERGYDNGIGKPGEEKVMLHNKSRIIFTSDSLFNFSMHILRDIVYNGRQVYVLHHWYDLNLRYIPQKNKIVGYGNKTRVYEAMGNNNYKSVSEAIEHGRGNVGIDCSGDCGIQEVIYRRY